MSSFSRTDERFKLLHDGIRTWPHVKGCDGFFIATFERQRLLQLSDLQDSAWIYKRYRLRYSEILQAPCGWIIAGARLRNLVSLVARIVSVFRSIAIVIAIAVVFLFGVATTVYLSLRSPEVKVPDVIGKDRFEAERILAEADLKFRVRATDPAINQNPTQSCSSCHARVRSSKQVKLWPWTSAVATKEGETPENVTPDEPSENRNTNSASKPQREQTEATKKQGTKTRTPTPTAINRIDQRTRIDRMRMPPLT